MKIDIQNISDELGKNPLETCLFNLIVYSPSNEKRKELDRILEQLLEKFPCRVIQIEKITETKTDEIKVTASKEKIGKKNIISEVIHILVSEKELERVPFIVLPNIVADLPVYLIWGEDPTKATKILEALQSFATRLIFDAAFVDHIQEFSQRMLDFLNKVKIEVMDISWGALSGYRNLLAEIFNSEEKITFLKQARKVIVRYSGNGIKDNLSAIYLQAFLASSLGFKLAAVEIHHEHQKALCYTCENQDINVILEEDTVTIAPKGAITQFEVTGKDGTNYSIYSSKNCSKAVLHVSSLETCELPCTFALPELNRGLNFLKEIFYQVPSKSYNQALEMIAKVNWEK